MLWALKQGQIFPRRKVWDPLPGNIREWIWELLLAKPVLSHGAAASPRLVTCMSNTFGSQESTAKFPFINLMGVTKCSITITPATPSFHRSQGRFYEVLPFYHHYKLMKPQTTSTTTTRPKLDRKWKIQDRISKCLILAAAVYIFMQNWIWEEESFPWAKLSSSWRCYLPRRKKVYVPISYPSAFPSQS